MKKIQTKGFISIGGVRYNSKTEYGRHIVIITQVLNGERLEIKFIHNDELRVIWIDDADLTLTEHI